MSANRSGSNSAPPTLEWRGEIPGVLRLIDQTLLPATCHCLDCTTVEEVWEAIRSLRVRGAPAIGVAAAYGVVLGIQSLTEADRKTFDRKLADVADYLAKSRPTAVNLFWSLDRMRRRAASSPTISARETITALLEEARTIEREDRAMCSAIGKHGAALLQGVNGVLTHCNAGGLATAGDGTALAVIFAAAARNDKLHVYADETRPLLQGARLTMWELMNREIPCTLICDSTAAWVMKQRRVQAVVTGADRITANGDAANKIGTYSLSVLARAHNIPFYIAAPSSTFDLSLSSGDEIPIEERAIEEITCAFGKSTAPHGAEAFNPAFDVTPASHITAIITERGVIRPVNAATVREGLGR